MSHSSEAGFVSPASPIAVGIQFGTSSYRLTYISPDSSTPAALLDCFGNESTPAYFAVDGDIDLYGDDARNFANISPDSCIKGIVKCFSNISSRERNKDVAEERGFGEKKFPEFLSSRMTPQQILQKTIGRLLDEAKQSFELPITITSIAASVSHCYMPDVNKVLKTAWTRETRSMSIVPKVAVAVVPKTMAAFVGYTMCREVPDGLYAVLFIGASGSELALYAVDAESATLKGHILSYPLGGDHFDEAVLQYCCTEFRKQHPIEWEQHPAVLQRLEIECEKAKNKLSAAMIVAIEIPRFIGDTKLRLQVRRIETESAMEDQVTAFSKWLVEHLAPAAPSLNNIVLAGGASRIPRLQSEVSRLFPGLVKSSVYSCAHVLVSNGCAYLARYISGLGSDRLLSQIHAGCLDLSAIRAVAVILVHGSPHTTEETVFETQFQLDETILELKHRNADCTTQAQNSPGTTSSKEHPFLGLPNSESSQSVELEPYDALQNVPRSKVQNDPAPIMSQMNDNEHEGGLQTTRMRQKSLHTSETDDRLDSRTLSYTASNVEATNAGMAKSTDTTKETKHTDTTVSCMEHMITEPKRPFEETEITDGTMEADTDVSNQADGRRNFAAKETCSEGQTTHTNVMISGKCESPDKLSLSKGQPKNKDDVLAGGVGIPTVAFEEIAIFRQHCKVEEQIFPRSGKELWVRSRYSAHIHINRCSVPGPSPYVIRLMPSDTMTEPIWLFFNQTKSVQRGNKSTESVFQVAADPRRVIQPDGHQLFVKLSFQEVAQQESFLRAMQQCTYF